MARFYFDFDDSAAPDVEGVELGTLDEAVSLAAATLAIMTGSSRPPPLHKSVAIRVGRRKIVEVTVKVDIVRHH